MLIPSPRISPRDHQVWDRLAAYDSALAGTLPLDDMEDEAVDVIRGFLDAGPATVSTSWGKDSVVVAHLATLADPQCMITWVRLQHFETPETNSVRDAFLNTHPGVRYREYTATARNPKRGEPGFDTRHLSTDSDHQDILKEAHMGRYVSGVRAEESGTRRKAMQWHGLASTGSCRPIGYWDATDVFAYLHSRNLPVHPVYAMSRGGHYDRRWLRVHPLGQAPRDTQHRGAEEWEDHYYGDVLDLARHKRKALFA